MTRNNGVKGPHMKNDRQHDNRGAVSGWEDDGGARDADPPRGTDHAGPATDTRQSEQQALDASHESDTRGEHRYDDLHQTASEQGARQERDQLKQRLATPRRRAR
jgi:hypothetical protein